VDNIWPKPAKRAITVIFSALDMAAALLISWVIDCSIYLSAPRSAKIGLIVLVLLIIDGTLNHGLGGELELRELPFLLRYFL
jgi:hypothetical protein